MLQKLLDKVANMWRSKVIIFNAVMLAILPFSDQIMANLPQLAQFLPEDTYKTIGAIAVVANMILRFSTSRPLEAK